MAYTNIDDPSAHFQAFTYTGNQSGRQITLDGNSDLQPDLYWYKARNANHHYWVDSSRGTTKYIYSSLTSAEATVASAYVTSFNTNGFGVGGGDSGTNSNGISFGNWAWKANGGTTATNTDGAINSTVQVNADAGFSILTYTMGSGNETVGHGLGVKPDIVITKARQRGDANGFWSVYTTLIDGSLDYLRLNDTNAKADSSLAAPTTTVFTGAGSGTVAYRSFVAYCFASKQGYSKFGSYIGSGNRDGSPFIYTGFQPAFIMVKNTASTTGWAMFDNKRIIANGDMHYLAADRADAESGTGFSHVDPVDFLSNGFKVMNSDAWMNTSGTSYLYMAFAQHPFVTSTGIPTTAR